MKYGGCKVHVLKHKQDPQIDQQVDPQDHPGKDFSFSDFIDLKSKQIVDDNGSHHGINKRRLSPGVKE